MPTCRSRIDATNLDAKGKTKRFNRKTDESILYLPQTAARFSNELTDSGALALQAQSLRCHQHPSYSPGTERTKWLAAEPTW